MDINQSFRRGKTIFYPVSTLLTRATMQDPFDIVHALLGYRQIMKSHLPGSKFSPLAIAILFRKWEMGILLLEYTTLDVNAVLVGGQTALTFAISARQAKASRRLLEYPGTDLNHRDQSGCSALALAIMDRQRDLVKRLLLHDRIDINQRMSPGLDGYR